MIIKIIKVIIAIILLIWYVVMTLEVSLLELSLSKDKSLSYVIEHRSLLEVSLSKDKSHSCVIEQLVI